MQNPHEHTPRLPDFRKIAALGATVLSVATFTHRAEMVDPASYEPTPAIPVHVSEHAADPNRIVTETPKSKVAETTDQSQAGDNTNTAPKPDEVRAVDPSKKPKNDTVAIAGKSEAKNADPSIFQNMSQLEIPSTPLPKSAELINLHPETLRVPENVSAIMRKDTVYIYGLRCSGFLVRDQADQPIGVRTAQHCGLLRKMGNVFEVNSTSLKKRADQPIVAATGDAMDQMVYSGKLTQFAVSDNEMNRDVAIGSFENADMTEVLNAGRFSAEAAKTTQKGETIYLSGWPTDQPANANGTKQRQEFAMHALGTAQWTISPSGQKLNLLLAAVPKNEDGAICSGGESGGLGFKLDENGNKVDLGVSSAFNDFGLLDGTDQVKAAKTKEYFQNLFGVSMDGYDAICGFAYEAPDETSTRTITVETPASAEPEKPPLEAFGQEVREHFFEDKNRTIVQGLVAIPFGKEGSKLYENPVIEKDAESESYALAYHDKNEEGGVGVFPMSLDFLQGLAVYEINAETPLVFGEANGLLTSNDETFATSAGMKFGKVHVDAPEPTTVPSYITYQDGKFSFTQPTTGSSDPLPPLK